MQDDLVRFGQTWFSLGVKDNNNMILLTPDFFTLQALEGLEVLGEEKDILKEIWWEMQFGSKEEVVIKAIKELMKSSTKSVKSSKWSLDNNILYHRGKIYIPNSDLWCHISILCHNSRIAGYTRRWKTLELVSRNYWWLQMSRYISRYVSVIYTFPPIPETPVGFQLDSRILCRFQLDSGIPGKIQSEFWNSGWIPGGFCVDSVWILCGFQVNSWTLLTSSSPFSHSVLYQ